MRRSTAALLLGALAFLPQQATSAAGQQEVDLKLVLAVDVSGSIDNEELQLEREGTADAFADPEVMRAIQNGSLGRIAVAMVDFSSDPYNKIVADWHIIRDRPSALQFADFVRKIPRSVGHRTSISSALELGTVMLESSDKDITSSRNVIDVSGDGPNNWGNHMQPAHDRTVADGIVINGLPVMDQQANGYFPDLDKYYAACVAGGRGSFVIVVRNYRDYAAGMRRKLVLEISRNGSPTQQKALANERLLTRVAAVGGPNAAPQLLRPGRNEFSNQCDNVTGPFSFGQF
ncbi:MAG TPA: DUF1194 domain-containing protein [Micropepsaceae bacterium]|nr:DUF1194 domain-containing protein [Micropepsaceae bacterium]